MRDRLLDWLCDRLGICIRLDGDLTAPDGTEPWWPALPATPDHKMIQARALILTLTDDASENWPLHWVIEFLEADGWVWDGRRWVSAVGEPVLSGAQVVQMARLQVKR